MSDVYIQGKNFKCINIFVGTLTPIYCLFQVLMLISQIVTLAQVLMLGAHKLYSSTTTIDSLSQPPAHTNDYGALLIRTAATIQLCVRAGPQDPETLLLSPHSNDGASFVTSFQSDASLQLTGFPWVNMTDK